jgi:hypothetical protein
VCFLVEYAFGTTYSTQESVVRFLPPMNALFLAGSALLFVDSLVVVYSHRRCTSFHKLVARICCRDDDDSAPHDCIELVVAGSYIFAGILGGYGESQGMVRASMFGWLVGSIVGLLETIAELNQRCMSSSRGCGQSNTQEARFDHQKT